MGERTINFCDKCGAVKDVKRVIVEMEMTPLGMPAMHRVDLCFDCMAVELNRKMNDLWLGTRKEWVEEVVKYDKEIASDSIITGHYFHSKD